MPIPTRHRVSKTVKATFGERAENFGRYLNESDPLADELLVALERHPSGMKLFEQALREGIGSIENAPPELKTFCETTERVPFWVDWDEIRVGGNAFLRSGFFGALVMACRSLPLCYASPSGNKPLVFSGNLVTQAPPRLADTGRFIVETCTPDRLRPFHAGYQATLRVRLKHAQIRKRVLMTGDWKREVWGHPINQADLAATNLMFSITTLDGLKRIGFRFSRRECHGFIQLWRYSGYLIGVDERLLCATEEESRRLAELILETQGEPDQDSQRLIQSLMDEGAYAAFLRHRALGKFIPAKLIRKLLYGFSEELVGDKFARPLGYPETGWARYSVPASRGIVSLLELGRVCVPGGTKVATKLGARILEGLVT